MRFASVALPFALAATAFNAPALAQRGAASVARAAHLEELGLTQPPSERLGTRPLAAGKRPAIMLTGYWPPSNEALRRFSADPAKNPAGWAGSNWEARGYDVYAYFPEFVPPDCDFCGIGIGELEVDYQDTLNDFFDFTDALEPIAVVTFSRGFIDHSWELEMNQYNRDVWIDDYLEPLQPTPSPPNSAAPVNELLPSMLPVQWIVDSIAAAGLGLDPLICISGNGGGFLSEFAAYLGVWYQSEHNTPGTPDWCVTAGHVHVGALIDWPTARTAAEITLRSVIDQVDAIAAPEICQTELGFGGPGSASLSICGDPMQSGATSDLRIVDAAPLASGLLAVGSTPNPTPLLGGTVVPLPWNYIIPIQTDPLGRVEIFGLEGGGGPLTLYVQYAYIDADLPFGVGLTNAVALDYLP